jgi:hypothetical protein
MPYVFSLTSRMVTIAATCAVLLCLLLFLLGVEIGARLNHAPGSTGDTLRARQPAATVTATSPAAVTPLASDPDASPAAADVTAPAADSASSTL